MYVCTHLLQARDYNTANHVAIHGIGEPAIWGVAKKNQNIQRKKVFISATSCNFFIFILSKFVQVVQQEVQLQSEQVNKHAQKYIEIQDILFWAYTNKVNYICAYWQHTRLNNSSFSARDNPFADNPNLQSVNSTIVLISSYSCSCNTW